MINGMTNQKLMEINLYSLLKTFQRISKELYDLPLNYNQTGTLTQHNSPVKKVKSKYLTSN